MAIWVEDGRLRMLDAQAAYIETLEWGLFTNDVTEGESVVFSDLTEAAWTGYSRVPITSVSPAVLVGGRASSTPSPFPVFNNTSGADQDFFGWFLIDPSDSTLLAFRNRGMGTIPDTGSYAIGPTITDTQE